MGDDSPRGFFFPGRTDLRPKLSKSRLVIPIHPSPIQNDLRVTRSAEIEGCLVILSSIRSGHGNVPFVRFDNGQFIN